MLKQDGQQVGRKVRGQSDEEGGRRSTEQDTSLEFTQLFKGHGIAISMGGKGCWRSNAFVEMLWKSIKYEEVCLRACETVSAMGSGIGCDPKFYNMRSEVLQQPAAAQRA